MNDINTVERSFSRSVTVIRQQLVLGQEARARQLGVNYATVNRWEKGHNIPSRLAQAQLSVFCDKMIKCGKLVLLDGQRR